MVLYAQLRASHARIALGHPLRTLRVRRSHLDGPFQDDRGGSLINWTGDRLNTSFSRRPLISRCLTKSRIAESRGSPIKLIGGLVTPAENTGFSHASDIYDRETHRISTWAARTRYSFAYTHIHSAPACTHRTFNGETPVKQAKISSTTVSLHIKYIIYI